MKKLLCLILVCCMCFVFAGCGEEYEDTNGADNYELQTITDENIINLSVGASNITHKETNVGVLHSSEYSSDNFNGVSQIYLEDYIWSSDITVYVGHMNVESGNFRLVVINDDEIIKDIPIDSFNDEFFFEDITGNFSIHVAGESAKFDFHIDVY